VVPADFDPHCVGNLGKVDEPGRVTGRTHEGGDDKHLPSQLLNFPRATVRSWPERARCRLRRDVNRHGSALMERPHGVRRSMKNDRREATETLRIRREEARSAPRPLISGGRIGDLGDP
jgi:hypothetical protein